MEGFDLELAARPAWRHGDYSHIPFWVYSDAANYQAELRDIYKGPVWNYLCLAAELPGNGDYKTTKIGETPVLVVRGEDGVVRGFLNRCAHRGALLCLEPRGSVKRLTCVYHAWSYDLEGNLKNVAFEDGADGRGGMPDDFDKSRHGLRPIEVTEFCGLVFGSFDPGVPDIETYLGPESVRFLKRALGKAPLKLIGRSTQVMHNNWKLYLENVKDVYHATILHLFFTRFRLNRLGHEGGIIVSDSGAHHVSYSKMDAERGNQDYASQDIRSTGEGFSLNDPSLLDSIDEWEDGITVQIQSVFPSLVIQVIQNSIAVRQILPTAVDRTDLNWNFVGFEGDSEEMTRTRVKLNNLVGPSGYISLEDGAIGGFVQRAIRGVEEDSGVVRMGGDDVTTVDYRATETSVRGFWKMYRGLMGV